MMKPLFRKAAGLTMASGLLLASHGASASDEKLLEILLKNHVITEEQHAQLAEAIKSEEETNLVKAADAMKIKIAGDVRFRHEAIDDDAKSPRRDKDRQRIRARIGAYANINEEVDAGIRIATGSDESPTSTNQSVGEGGATTGIAGFNKYEAWVDLAYLDWHPEALRGAHLIAGKMKQPWISTADMIFDSDLNPDGLAVSYSANNGLGNFTTSAGYMVFENGASGPGTGVKFSDDINLLFMQAAQSISLMEKSSLTAGVSLYDYDDEVTTTDTLGLADNSSTSFKLWELFANLDIKDTPLPFRVYSQYVNNAAADIDEFTAGAFAGDTSKGEDGAWLVGIGTKIGKFSLDYNYRDIERNAVVDGLQDSDWAIQHTDAKGHKFMVNYDISKNFAVGATYFDAEYEMAGSPEVSMDTDTLQLDVVGKF